MGQEQRQFLRLGVRLLTWVKLPSGKVQRALTKDLSPGGLCFLMEGAVAPGTRLELELKLPDREAAVSFTAEVKWSRPVAAPAKGALAPTCEVGLQLLAINPKDQALIIQYARLNALPDAS